jgi:hypothetical protein
LGHLAFKNSRRKSRKAAERTRDAIIRTDTIALISAAVTAMDEIKRLHRVPAWQILPDRYSELRKLLIAVRGANTNLQPDYASVLQGTIQQFSTMEEEVERALTSNRPLPNQARLNKIVSTQGDNLLHVLEKMKRERETGDGKND